MHFACFALRSYEISAFYRWQIGSFLLILRPSFRKASGEVLEWLKRHAWKACIRLKRITGSNPVLSAECAGQKPDNKQKEGVPEAVLNKHSEYI